MHARLTRQLASERERVHDNSWSRRKRIDTRFDRDRALEKTIGSILSNGAHSTNYHIYRRKLLTSLSTQVLQQPFNLDTRVGKYTEPEEVAGRRTSGGRERGGAIAGYFILGG